MHKEKISSRNFRNKFEITKFLEIKNKIQLKVPIKISLLENITIFYGTLIFKQIVKVSDFKLKMKLIYLRLYRP